MRKCPSCGAGMSDTDSNGWCQDCIAKSVGVQNVLSLDPAFLKHRDDTAERLRVNARNFTKMADYIADSKTPEQLQERIQECMNKAQLESGLN